MKVKFGLRQAAVSTAVFVAVLAGLVSVDARVQERFTDLVAGHSDVTSFTARGAQLGDALAIAFRTQSIENAPLMVFAAVGALLFLFMVRT